MKKPRLYWATFKDFVASPPWIGAPSLFLADLIISNELMLIAHAQHADAEIAALANIIIEKLGLDTDLVQACVPVVLENLALMNRKQHDYGPHNLTRFGTMGVVVRMTDKQERLANLVKPGAAARVQDEGVADTFRDQSNYGLIGYVLEKQLWPRKDVVLPRKDVVLPLTTTKAP